tara:strand:- start:159 stop:305 length:147 start_codon:yes stop_codon:yes gene_type:complete
MITFSVKNAVTIVLSVAEITGTINGIAISFFYIAHVIFVTDQDDPSVP